MDDTSWVRKIVPAVAREDWYKSREYKPGILYLFVMEYFVTKRVIRERKVFHDLERIVEREVVQQPLYAATIDAAIVMMNSVYAQNGLGHLHKSLEQYPQGIEINGIRYEPTQRWVPPVLEDDGQEGH